MVFDTRPGKRNIREVAIVMCQNTDRINRARIHRRRSSSIRIFDSGVILAKLRRSKIHNHVHTIFRKVSLIRERVQWIFSTWEENSMDYTLYKRLLSLRSACYTLHIIQEANEAVSKYSLQTTTSKHLLSHHFV